MNTLKSDKRTRRKRRRTSRERRNLKMSMTRRTMMRKAKALKWISSTSRTDQAAQPCSMLLTAVILR